MSSREGSPDLSDTLAAEQAERCREKEDFKSGILPRNVSDKISLGSQVLVEIRTNKKVLLFLSNAVLPLRSATEHYLSAIC